MFLFARSVAYGRDISGRLITDVDPTLAGKIVKQLRGWAKTSVFSKYLVSVRNTLN